MPILTNLVFLYLVKLLFGQETKHCLTLIFIQLLRRVEFQRLFFNVELVDAVFIGHFVLVTLIRDHGLHAEADPEDGNVFACLLVLLDDLVEDLEGLEGRFSLVAGLVLHVVEGTRDEDAIDFVQETLHLPLGQVKLDGDDLAPALLDELHVVEGHLLLLVGGYDFGLVHDAVDFLHYQADHWFIVVVTKC